MPWKHIDKKDARRDFVAARWNNAESMVVLCRRFGISRQCGYEWWHRAQAGAVTYADGSHRTGRAQALAARWHRRVRRLRQRYCFAGPAQLRWYLQRAYPLGPWPAVRTIGRWLAQAGLTRKHRHHPKVGPRVERNVPVARVANDVWTVDFKGWFLTQDGRRVKALTVRDLATRYVLHVAHMESTTERAVTAAMRRLFARYGLPRAIRVDNGPPFGGYGPHGWSTLTVAWICLGIDVLYGRPGCPQDNAAHEQMHRVLHQHTAKPSAGSLRAQQRRFERWRRHYNHDRPHQALGMQVPAALYQRSDRQPQPLRWTYPPAWLQKRTDPRGRIRWRGRARLIGQAFGHRTIALRPGRPGVVRVYFGPHLLGELHATDTTAIRPVCLRLVSKPQPQSRAGRELRPLPRTLPKI
jgi:transposase InsO family protein